MTVATSAPQTHLSSGQSTQRMVAAAVIKVVWPDGKEPHPIPPWKGKNPNTQILRRGSRTDYRPTSFRAKSVQRHLLRRHRWRWRRISTDKAREHSGRECLDASLRRRRLQGSQKREQPRVEALRQDRPRD